MINNFNTLFTVQNIIIYVVIINIIGFAIMFIDKQKAKNNRWRIKEGTIFIVTLLGGGVGTIAGMHIFRHKTKKPIFIIGLPIILIAEIVLIIYFMIK